MLLGWLHLDVDGLGAVDEGDGAAAGQQVEAGEGLDLCLCIMLELENLVGGQLGLFSRSRPRGARRWCRNPASHDALDSDGEQAVADLRRLHKRGDVLGNAHPILVATQRLVQGLARHDEVHQGRVHVSKHVGLGLVRAAARESLVQDIIHPWQCDIGLGGEGVGVSKRLINRNASMAALSCFMHRGFKSAK